MIIYLSPIIVIYALLLTTYYIRTTRNLTRLQRISYAPIMTVFSETIRGLDIIRTCHSEENMKNIFLEKIDDRYGIHLFSAGLRRWHAIRRSTFINLNFGVIIIHNFRICRDILNNSKTSKKSDYSIIRRKKNNNNNNQNLNEV